MGYVVAGIGSANSISYVAKDYFRFAAGRFRVASKCGLFGKVARDSYLLLFFH
jgi:hypothetical protein